MLTEIGKRVKNAATGLSVASTEDKNRILKAIATALRENCDEIFVAQETIPARGHQLGEVETIDSPTCLETGMGKQTCERDGCEYFEFVAKGGNSREIFLFGRNVYL